MATLEERFALLESRVAELELAKQAQEDRDIALLARIDGFIDDLRRVERVQMRAFDSHTAQIKDLAAEVKDLTAEVKDLAAEVEDAKGTIAILVDAAKDHKQAIESLAQGQQQILTILTGGQRHDD